MKRSPKRIKYQARALIALPDAPDAKIPYVLTITGHLDEAGMFHFNTNDISPQLPDDSHIDVYSLFGGVLL